jgi:geranylgeranyl diphosphate synthase type 3
MSEEEQILQEPYHYITQVPGKDIRSKLINAFNLWLEVPEEHLDTIKVVTKMLHNASLLIDDIEDNSKLRRGVPVAHMVYGVAQTINCANYIYFQCMAKIMELGKPEAAQAFTDQLLELHRGQGMDIYWRDAFVCPTEEEYKQMVLRKTGGLFELAVRLMQLFSKDDRNYSPLLEVFGLYFQIRDDYANLQSKEYAENKSFCEDITEGKFSFPIIHSIRSNPQDRQLLSILKQHTEDVDLKKHCLECMRRTKTFEYTIGVLNDLEIKARQCIEDLGGNAILVGILDVLCKLHHPEQEQAD